MKSLKKLRAHFKGKSISPTQAEQLKGGDDKRNGPSGGEGTPPASGGSTTIVDMLYP